MTYTYEVPTIKYRTQIDTIYIVVKMKWNEIAFGVDIDYSFVIDYLKKEIGGKFTFDQNFFQRDSAAFPFVSKIEITNTEEYFQYKRVRQRRLKLEQLKNKLNV